MWSTSKRLRNDLILRLGLYETVDHLAVTINVHWYGHVLRRKVDHVSRRALEFEVEGHRKKWMVKRT